MSQTARTALAEFAKSRDEAAFRRVVDEFGGLVLRAAFRRTSDQGLAEEVAQNVFAIMARKAKRVAKHASISGWVFTTVRLEAAKALRGRQRHRRKLDALAEELQTATNDMSDDDLEQWREALPHLEQGLDKLGDAEREILLARFFEGKSFAEIAAETGKSEAACKMRMRRSLDKLNGWMGRRGVTISATVLATGLAAEWVKAAPSMVSAALTSNAVTAASAVGTGTILTNTLLTMNATKSAAVAVTAILAVGAIPLAVQQSEATALREEISGLRETALADGRRSGDSPSGLGPSVAGGTPAKRFLEKSKMPDDPDEFVASLVAAAMEQDMIGMMRAILPVSQMSDEEIEALIAEISKEGANPMGKQVALPMLMAFMDKTGEDHQVALDRALESGVAITSMISKLSAWVEEDPAAAVAWYRRSRDAGKFDGKGVDTSGEHYALMAMVPVMAKTDLPGALALIDESDPDSQHLLRGTLVASFHRDGDEERSRGVLVSINDAAERERVFEEMAMEGIGAKGLEQAATFARSLGFDEAREAAALSDIARGARALDWEERADWLVRETGAAGLREFVAGATMEGQSPAAIAAWVDALPAGETRQNALQGELEALGRRIGHEHHVFERAPLVEDQSVRERAIGRALMILNTTDPDAAAEAAERLGVEVPK